MLLANVAAISEAGFRSGPWKRVVAIVRSAAPEAPAAAARVDLSETGRELDLLDIADGAQRPELDIDRLRDFTGLELAT